MHGLGEAFHVKNHIILDDRRGMSLACGVADDFQQLIDSQSGVGEQHFIVVEIFAKQQKIIKRSIYRKRIYDRDRTKS